MKKRYTLFAVCLSLTALLALGGCQSAQESNTPADKGTQTEQATATQKKDATPSEAEKVSLSDWDGEWNNITTYFDEPELQASFEKVAQRDGGTAQSQKEDLIKRRNCEFGAVKIAGDKVTFYDKTLAKGGKEISSATYTFERSQKVKHGNHELEWDIFTTKDAQAKYPVILMMPIHGEESLTHFHMRYGNDADKLPADEKWYPALIKTTSTLDQLKGEIEE